MNDSFDRNLVVLIFIVAITYLNFLALQIRTRSGWTNITCNPLNLFANSLFQSQEDANKDFERCVVNLSAATTTNLFRQHRDDQERVVTNLTTIEEQYGTLAKSVDGYTKEVSSVVDDYNKKIDSVKESQQKANELNNTTTKKIDTYIQNIEDIFRNIKSYFNI
jgi:ABC-type transporter Mla subunit MlaD